MKTAKLLTSCAIAALVSGCAVHRPPPLAVVRPAPIFIGPAPVVVGPAYYQPHPGRGGGHHKHHKHHRHHN